MPEKKRRSDRVQMAVPIRVRGMSAQTKFFDEQTQTDWISAHGVMTRLSNLVELETEVHVTNLENNLGGNFRVAWVNQRNDGGFHSLGLELIDSDGDLWEVHFPSAQPGEEEVTAQAWLECQRCHQKFLSTIPETEYEYLTEGFLIARACDHCRATTPWEITTEPAASPPVSEEKPETRSVPAKGKTRPPREEREEKRGRGRAPLQMQIKVTRQKYGTEIVDICETVNVSRNGAYFLTAQNYEVGEGIKVVLPYKEGDLAIPISARVVRQDQPDQSYYHAVAIHIEAKK